MNKQKEAVTAARQQLHQYYESHKGDAAYEPEWIHPFFEVSTMPDDAIIRAANSLKVADGTICEAFPGLVGSPLRIIHDGWKVGTTSWVFFGRRTPAYRRAIGSWVVLGRTYEGETIYMAYNRKRRMRCSALSNDEIGPCRSSQEIEALIGVINDNVVGSTTVGTTKP